MLILKLRRVVAPVVLILAAVLFTGCGNLTDKDLIVVAEIEGQEIRRGDLRKLIRDMDDDKRPIIHNRADLLRVLNRHIDDTILNDVAARLRKESKIDVPREQAEAIYFSRYPEDRTIYELEDAEDLQHQDFDVSTGQLAAFQADIDFKIDDVEEELYRDAALMYLIQDAVASGRMTITQEEFQHEYESYRNRLFFHERVGFVGIRFDANIANAAEKAAECRALLDEGRTFEQLLNLYHSIDPDLVFSSMAVNDPQSTRFRGFWDKVSGAGVGDVFGPLFLPAHDLFDQQKNESITHPAAYVVIQITQHEAPREKSWQDAQVDLAPQILRRKMMRQLRQQHGVQIYEDKLPDPGRYDKEDRGTFVDADF